MEIVRINNYDELKKYFMNICTYWNKKGKIRMLPIGMFLKQAGLGQIYYLKNNENVIGILSYIDRNPIKLEILAIHKDHLNQGYGKQVLEFLKTKNCPIKTVVMEDNLDAIRFYENNGFVKDYTSFKKLYMIYNINGNSEKVDQ